MFRALLKYSVEQATVIGGEVAHVCLVLQTAFYLERAYACINHEFNLLRGVKVAQREQVFIAAQQFPLGVVEVVLRAAWLCAASAVAATVGKILTQVALAAERDAEGSMYERLQLYRCRLPNLPHTLQRGLTGKYDSLKSHLLQKSHLFGCVIMRLRTGVQCDRRQVTFKQAHILNNKGIDADIV